MTSRTGRAIAVVYLGSSVLLAAAVGHAETARYDVDPDHSIVEFKVAHMVISKNHGALQGLRWIYRNGPRCGDGEGS